jgi:hypothetical protein
MTSTAMRSDTGKIPATIEDDDESPAEAGLYPYDNASGEVDMYRLVVSISELGEAYLKVEDFVAQD